MKPGKRDKSYHVLISGQELEELQRQDMPESLGLGNRIERYKGTRPIKLYRWDIEYLIDLTYFAIRDDYPTKEGGAYEAMINLHKRLEELYKEITKND